MKNYFPPFYSRDYKNKYDKYSEKLDYSNIYDLCDLSLIYHSRIHPLISATTTKTKVYVKREDESGFGISGYKKRKYASIIPYLERNLISHVFIIGGTHSNHVSGILQLLREKNIQPELLLKMPNSSSLKGNAFLLNLLVDNSSIHWIEKKNWPDINGLASIKAQQHPSASFIIPEGGSCKEALPGLCTMFIDITRNEMEHHLSFNHIFIDAGTGLSAAVLFLLLSLFDHPAQLSIILMAEGEKEFNEILTQAKQWLMELFKIHILPKKKPILLKPISAKSFGSVNHTVLQATKRLAREDGLLTDPIYSTKLFMTANHYIREKELTGNILIIHSGGGTGLFGFQDRLI